MFVIPHCFRRAQRKAVKRQAVNHSAQIWVLLITQQIPSLCSNMELLYLYFVKVAQQTLTQKTHKHHVSAGPRNILHVLTETSFYFCGVRTRLAPLPTHDVGSKSSYPRRISIPVTPSGRYNKIGNKCSLTGKMNRNVQTLLSFFSYSHTL